MIEVERYFDEPLEILLHRKWVIENKSVKQVMDELKVNNRTLYRWLKLTGIYSRKLELYKKQKKLFY